MTPLRIATSRLEVIEVTPRLAQANLDDMVELARLLDATVAGTWPAEHWEPDAIRWLMDKAAAQPDERGWFAWYVLRKQNADERPVLIGTCGIKGPPDPDGVIEIGYGIVSECRRMGFATEATRGLIAWALRDPRIRVITAETFPHLIASLGVMRSLGMKHLGDGSEPGVVRYGVTRAEWEDRCRDSGPRQ